MQVGEFQVFAELARGSTATVYRARAPRLGHDVALKLGHPDGDATRFVAGADALRALDHPGVVALHDQGEHQGQPFQVLDLIEGPTLAARLREQGPMRPGQAAQLLHKLALAVAHAHERGVVHGALDATHVVLGRKEPRLISFRGSSETKPRDIVALGTLLQTVLAGSKNVDPDLEDLGRLCQSDAAERPTASTLAAELEAFLDYGSSEERLWNRAQAPRRRLVVGLTGALGVLLLVAAILVTVLVRRGTPEPTPVASARPTTEGTPEATPSPTPSASPLQRAEELRAAGRFKEALPLLDLAVRETGSAEAHLTRGRVQLALGNLADAQADLRRALALAPASLPARQVLAKALVRDGRWEDARLQLEVVLRRAPKDSWAWRSWGRASLLNGAWGDALHGLRRSLELAPEDPAGHAELARFYTRAKRHDLALTALAKALSKKASPELHLARLCAALRAGDLALATSELDRVRGSKIASLEELDPALQEGRQAILAAARAWRPEQRKTALALLGRLVARFQSSWVPADLLATLHLLKGELPEARAAFSTAVDRDPKTTQAASAALTRLLLGERRQALELLSAAADTDPKAVRYGLAVGVATCLTGDLQHGWSVGIKSVTRLDRTPSRILAAAALHNLTGHRPNAEGLLRSGKLERLIPSLPAKAQAARVARLQELMIAGSIPCLYPTARLRDTVTRFGGDPWIMAWAAGAAGVLGHPPALRLEILAKLQSLLPEDPLIARQLGRLLLEQGKLELATKLGLDARKRWPGDLTFLMFLARIEGAAGRGAGAIARYREALGILKHPMFANNLAVRLGLDPKTRPEALKLARFAVAADPKQSASTETLAWILAQGGQLDEARTTMRTALKLDPGSMVAWAHYADLLFQLGEREPAQRALAVAEILYDHRIPSEKQRERTLALSNARKRSKDR